MLDACAELVDEVGYEGLTTTLLAERAEVAIGSVYQFFPDKRAIVQALAMRNLDAYLQGLSARFESETFAHWWDGVDAAIDVYIHMHRAVAGFRTLHFGLTDSHARGMAIQMNFLLDHGGFVSHGDGTFSVDFAKIKGAVADLDREFLTIEATGDYARAQAFMTRYVVIRPDVQKGLDKMQVVPNDIRPAFTTAAKLR